MSAVEAINSIAQQASVALFGDATAESSKEPKAGEQGKGNVGDPYDHGNQENRESETSADNRDGPSEAQSGPKTGDPESAPAPAVKQQGADKPSQSPEESNDGKPKVPHTDEEREKAMETGNFPRDPNDRSGEPLKMHAAPGEASGEDSLKPELDDKDQRRSSVVSQEGGEPHGANKGTGEEYVKSSGLKADGGDFDAKNPGAGAEANRLLEEKGIVKDGDNHGAPQAVEGDSATAPASAAVTDTKASKPSKLERLKEKLHISK